MRQRPSGSPKARLTAVLEATKVIASSLDLEQSLQAIIQQATIISGTNVVRLFLLDEEAKVLRCRVRVGLPPEEEQDIVIPVGDGFSGQVAATGKPLVVADMRNDPRLLYSQHAVKHGLVSYLGLPVKLGDRVLGVLVFNTRSPRRYSPAEIAYLSAFADQAAIAIENARLFQEEQEWQQQMEAVRTVSEEITRELDLDRVLDLIIRRAVELVSADSGTIRLWDGAEQLLIPRQAAGVSPRNLFRLRLGEGVAGVVAERRQAMIVNDFRTSPLVPAYILERTTHHATLAQPLLYHDRLVGVINVDRESAERPFTEADRDLLGLFATHAAIAIENARLYAAERERQKQLEAVRAATTEITRELDLTTLLALITQRSVELLGAAAGSIYLWDEAGEVLIPWAWHNLGEWMRAVRLKPGEAVAGTAAQRRQGMIVNDLPASPYAFPLFLERAQATAVLAEPLLYRDRLVGVIALNHAQAGRQFTEEHQHVLRLLADQAAIAIENARLHEAAQKSAQQATVLNELTRSLMGSLNPQGLAQKILEAAQTLTPGAAVTLREREGDMLRLCGRAGFEIDAQRPVISLGDGLAGIAAATAKPVIAEDLSRDPRAANQGWIAREQLVSGVALPLIFAQEVCGTISIYTHAPHRFSQEEINLLQAFADAASITLQNTRLHESAVQRARHLEMLNDVTRMLTAELDLEAVFKGILAAVQTLLPGAAARLWQWPKGSDELHLVASIGLRYSEGGARLRMRVGEGLLGVAVTTRRPVISPDLMKDPRFIDKALAEAEGLVSSVALPLVRGEVVHGVLEIATRSPHDFIDEEISLLLSFAAQATIAIEHARLHEGLTTRLKRQQALIRLNQLISSSLNVDVVLSEIAQAAAELMRDTHVTFWMVDEASRTLAPRAFSNAGIADYPKKALRFGVGGVGWVAEHRQPLNVPDRYADERFFAQTWAKKHGFVSFLGVPVVLRDSLLAVLVLNGRQPFRLDPDDQSLLDTFVAQAAIAIENARLYDTIRQHAAELEVRVRQRTAELEEALRVRVEFLGKMSHELRTPLNFVLGFSDLLRQGVAGPLTSKQATYVDRIQGGGKRLLSLVTDVLDIAQVDVGKSRLQLEPVILGSLVQEVLGLVQVQASQKRLHITTSLDPWLPFIVADRFKLGQILHRLVSNAVKFTPDGGSIRLEAGRIEGQLGDLAVGRSGATPSCPVAESPGRPAEFIEFRVQDTGIGIRPEDLETIFAAFHQVDSSDTRAYEGAGLGLTLVRRLVEQHGGRVWAESPGLGQGARFVVRLPRLAIPRAKTVLLVEDDGVVRASMTTALESAGFKVVQAADGSQALAALAGEPPDLLILDLVLPDMDGWEILRRARGIEEIPRFPVLVLTGLEAATAEEAIRLGADEFLSKPVSPRVLVETVLRLLTQLAIASWASEGKSDRGTEGPRE